MGRPIDKLTVEGFKSIRSLKDFELNDLNILIGANGAGKSNFVNLFSLLRAITEKELQSAVAEAGGAYRHLFMGPKKTREVRVGLYFGQNSYEVALLRTVDNTFVIAEEILDFIDPEGQHHPQQYGGGAKESVLPESKDHPGVHYGRGPNVSWYVCDAVSSWTVYHFHDTSTWANVRGEQTVRDYEDLRPDAGNLAAFLLRLRRENDEDYKLIRNTIRLAAPFFDDFLLRPENSGQDEVVQLEWKQRNSNYPFHPSQLSDGTLRFVCLATALMQPDPPATMLFDEPELGLHPYALSLLAGLFKQAAQRTQVIVSTQSAALLDFFEPKDVIVVDRIKGASEFRRLGQQELSEWLQDYSLGELWQKNVFEGGPAHE